MSAVDLGSSAHGGSNSNRPAAIESIGRFVVFHFGAEVAVGRGGGYADYFDTDIGDGHHSGLLVGEDLIAGAPGSVGQDPGNRAAVGIDVRRGGADINVAVDVNEIELIGAERLERLPALLLERSREVDAKALEAFPMPATSAAPAAAPVAAVVPLTVDGEPSLIPKLIKPETTEPVTTVLVAKNGPSTTLVVMMLVVGRPPTLVMVVVTT